MRPSLCSLFSRIRCFSSSLSDKAALEVLASLSQVANGQKEASDYKEEELPSISYQQEQRNKDRMRERAVWSNNHLTKQPKERTWGSWGTLSDIDFSSHLEAKAEERRIDPTSEFGPVRTLHQARNELRWSIESLLRQRGFKNQDSGSPKSIALLSRKTLDALAVDCGLAHTKSQNQHQLASLLSSIILEQSQKVQEDKVQHMVQEDKETSVEGLSYGERSSFGQSSSASVNDLPGRVKTWLIESHCTDVVSVDSKLSGRPSHIILATASSQRQAYSSCFAVKSQARDQLMLSCPPQLIGSRGIDWVSVFIDQPEITVGVHVLTERARLFYKLEELLVDN